MWCKSLVSHSFYGVKAIAGSVTQTALRANSAIFTKTGHFFHAYLRSFPADYPYIVIMPFGSGGDLNMQTHDSDSRFKIYRSDFLLFLSASGLALLLVAGSVFGETRALEGGVYADNRMPSLAPMLESVTPAVVTISVTRLQRLPDPLRFFGGPEPRGPSANNNANDNNEGAVRRSRGAGSGVVIDNQNGYIVTNHHVVNGADSVSVGLADGRVYEATLIGGDQQTDIALLKIDADRLAALQFADTDKLRVGDYVVAIGNPFGIGQTVTSGIISALGRAGINNENYEDFIQTDAAINVGNSGGALVDLNGRLVGINTAIISGTGTNSGVGFAVPVDMVAAVVGHLQRDGVVRRGQLGVIIRDHSPAMEEALQLGAERGALITQVMPGSPADQAGLQVSDLVTAVDGRPVLGSRELRNAVGLAGVDQEIRLDVMRDGAVQRFTTLIIGSDPDRIAASENRKASERSLDEARFLGAQLQNSANTNGQGLQVASVDQQSRAWAAGLRPGDVIRDINRQPVTNLREFNEFINEEPKVLALGIVRDGQRLMLFLS
jgi:serine protease DegQ